MRQRGGASEGGAREGGVKAGAADAPPGMREGGVPPGLKNREHRELRRGPAPAALPTAPGGVPPLPAPSTQHPPERPLQLLVPPHDHPHLGADAAVYELRGQDLGGVVGQALLLGRNHAAALSCVSRPAPAAAWGACWCGELELAACWGAEVCAALPAGMRGLCVREEGTDDSKNKGWRQWRRRRCKGLGAAAQGAVLAAGAGSDAQQCADAASASAARSVRRASK